MLALTRTLQGGSRLSVLRMSAVTSHAGAATIARQSIALPLSVR